LFPESREIEVLEEYEDDGDFGSGIIVDNALYGTTTSGTIVENNLYGSSRSLYSSSASIMGAEAERSASGVVVETEWVQASSRRRAASPEVEEVIETEEIVYDDYPRESERRRLPSFSSERQYRDSESWDFDYSNSSASGTSGGGATPAHTRKSNLSQPSSSSKSHRRVRMAPWSSYTNV
jgi:hypothetical protein